VIAILPSVITSLLSIPAGSPPELYTLLNVASFAFAVCVIGRADSRLRRYLRQLRARGAVVELKKDVGRKPALYLRSFALEQWDRPTIREFLFGPRTTAEQRLSKILRAVGPMLAIGRPNEKLPPIGAARLYVSDALWRQKVADIAQVSRLVVWTTGISEGLRWELSHLLASVPIERIILWAHPHLLGLGRAERQVEWKNFRESLGKLLPQPLPEKLGETRFICFKKDGELVAVAARRTLLDWVLLPFRSSQDVALRSVLKIVQAQPHSDQPKQSG
jgi:hypothetical protein